MIDARMSYARLAVRIHLMVVAAILCCASGGVSAQTAAPAAAQAVAAHPEQPLSADDVSWLFPAPSKAADLANLIAISDLTVPSAQDPAKRDPKS
jgi:hypothetical protein